jgi:hypothetical protein
MAGLHFWEMADLRKDYSGLQPTVSAILLAQVTKVIETPLEIETPRLVEANRGRTLKTFFRFYEAVSVANERHSRVG